MQTVTLLFAILQVLSVLVAAHPFVIVNSITTHVQVHAPQQTHHYERRQLLSELQSAANSVFGIEDDTTSAQATSTKAAVTLLPPVTASATTDSQETQSTSTAEEDNEDDEDDENDEGESTSSSEESSTTESEASTSTTGTSTTETSTTLETSSSTSSVLTTGATPVPSPTLDNAQATATADASKDDDHSNGVPPGGIAVAVIMSLLILAATAWLIFKYHPKSQAWWAARQDKQFRERSHRDALDGANAESPSLREEALSGSASKRQTLKSFFVPATAKLGQGKEIKRKPVQWGVESPKPGGAADAEKISMTATAAPMGQIERYSMLPSESAAQPVSPVSLRAKQSLEKLPPISPISAYRELAPVPSATAGHDLPALPPVPAFSTPAHAKRGSDGVFRLA